MEREKQRQIYAEREADRLRCSDAQTHRLRNGPGVFNTVNHKRCGAKLIQNDREMSRVSE